MRSEFQARSKSLAWTNPVSWWWAMLTLISGVNIAAWILMYRELHDAGSSGRIPGMQIMLLLSAAYVFGCAFRSLLPRADVQRICLFDTWLSSVAVGRSVATVVGETLPPPESTVKVSVPAGPSGVRSAAGGLLATAYTAKFRTTSYSTLRLQQLLAQLGYLPLTWTPTSGSPPAADASAQLQAAYSPPAGSFSWQSGYPGTLKNMWSDGSANLIDVGAIRAFESVQGLTMDGVAGPAVWRDLLQAAEKSASNPNGYTYAIASKADPETLTIWHDGHVVLHTYANTGIPAAPTYNGTYPVYERLPFQIMKGTNPDGSKYADPVQNVSYFHGGEAVHYFPRGSYGWPQSLGCVELPLPESAVAYRYLTYGSLVTVKA